MKADATDLKILDALMDDGRASLSQVARRTSLTTPTVSARLERMMRAGLITKFVPLISPESVGRGVQAIVTLRVISGSPEAAAKEFAEFREVEGVYVTTGLHLTLKLTLESVRALQDFLSVSLGGRTDAEVVSSEIVTRVVKEGPPAPLAGALTIDLRCDYCGGSVTSGRPPTISVGSSRYYFCCKTCKRDYLEKHEAGLRRLKSLRP